ncbi:hypothetical protein [Defluviitalea phaphyphila]|uniref:hypothetical protein n=1 Tax=Defluviitalea phaphyphila TaxID=1473580 RepID=UPI000730E870|nr:hypothetical protein [Defluviitalea phaphyphila]
MAKHEFGIIDSFEENKWYSDYEPEKYIKANSHYQSQELESLIEMVSTAINENKYLIHYGI